MFRILVAEGMRLCREAITASLRGAEYEVLAASDGSEALRLAIKHAPDVVVLDADTAVLDCLSCLAAMRANPHTRATPVMLLAASADRGLVERAARLGVQDYLIKSSLSLDDLVQRIRRRLAPRLSPVSAARGSAPPATRVAEPAPQPRGPASDAAAPLPRLLTRDQCLERARAALQGAVLSGVAAEVVAVAGSPRCDLAQLAGILGKDPMDPLARLLRIAEHCANGSLLVSSEDGPVAPLPRSVCRIAAGQQEPSLPDPDALRSEVFGLAALLGRLSPREMAQSTVPLLDRHRVRVGFVCDPKLAGLNPIHMALQSTAEPQPLARLPQTAAEWEQLDALVIVGRSTTVSGLSGLEIERSMKLAHPARPALWLVGNGPDRAAPASGGLTPHRWPVALSVLHELLHSAAADQDVDRPALSEAA